MLDRIGVLVWVGVGMACFWILYAVCWLIRKHGNYMAEFS